MQEIQRQCKRCGAPCEMSNDRRILWCPFCKNYYELSEEANLPQNTNTQVNYIQTLDDCLKEVDKCFLSFKEYRFFISQIIDYILSEQNFNIAYQVMKKIDKLHDLEKGKQNELALYFIERMDRVIEDKIHPYRNFILYTSPTWRKGFKNDDYIGYRDITLKYKRRRGK